MRFFYLGLMLFCLQASPLFALTLAGTGDSEMLLQRLATEYHRLHSDREVYVPASVGSGGGIRMLLQGRSELARVARPLSQAEKQQGLSWRGFAQVPIVFIANLPLKCMTDLNSKQILGIFNGKYRRWSQLGNCPDQKIYLARREAGDSSNRILYQQISGLREIQYPVGRIIYTTHEAFETIANHPYTLGYLPVSQIKGSSLIQFSINGVMPNSESMANRSYVLLLQLALVWKAPLSEEAKQFLQFLETTKAQEVIRSFGGIPASERDI